MMQPTTTDLVLAVQECLPRLRIISAILDTYGGTDDAQALRGIICRLERETPPLPVSADARDFTVNGKLRVSRKRVFRLLAGALADGSKYWCGIAGVRGKKSSGLISTAMTWS